MDLPKSCEKNETTLLRKGGGIMKLKDIKQDMKSRFQLHIDLDKEAIKEQITFLEPDNNVPFKTKKWSYQKSMKLAVGFMSFVLLAVLSVFIMQSLGVQNPETTDEPTSPNVPTTPEDASSVEEQTTIVYQNMESFSDFMELLESTFTAQNLVDEKNEIVNSILILQNIIHQKQDALSVFSSYYNEEVRNISGASYQLTIETTFVKMKVSNNSDSIVWVDYKNGEYQAQIEIEGGNIHLAKLDDKIQFLLETENKYWYIEMQDVENIPSIAYFETNYVSTMYRFFLEGETQWQTSVENPNVSVIPNSESLKGTMLP